METNNGIPKSNEQIDQTLRQKQIQSGELVTTDFADFHFPYLFDPRFPASPNYKDITALNLPKITVEEVEKIVRDLQIKKKIDITQQVRATGEARIIPEYGFGAWADSTTVAQFYFDPNNPRVLDSLRKRYPQQIAHELNHLARRQKIYAGDTLLDAFIFEGLATKYEEQWGKRPLKTPWGHALIRKQLIQEWSKALAELNSTDYSPQSWFFDLTGKHPRWTGYSLGLAIVDGYSKRHPQLQMRNMIGLPSVEVLDESGFGQYQGKFFGLFSRR